MRVRTISTPPAVAMAPPESPVPAPRGTIGTPSVAQSLTTDATWSVLVGKTTRSGAARWCVVSASRSYTRSSSGADTTPSVPTIFLTGMEKATTCLDCHGDSGHEETVRLSASGGA